MRLKSTVSSLLCLSSWGFGEACSNVYPQLIQNLSLSWKPCKQPLNILLAFVIKTVLIIFRGSGVFLCLKAETSLGRILFLEGSLTFARALGEEQGSNKSGRGLCKYTEHRLGSKNLGVTPGTKYLWPFASTFWCLLPWSGALWNQSLMEMIIMFKVLLNKQFHLDS